MAGRDERIAANEALARTENEERGDWFQTHSRVVFACECYLRDCPGMVSLSREEYERVRSRPTTFAVQAGHVDESVESAVAKYDTHWITEKETPDGRRVATELDPRSD